MNQLINIERSHMSACICLLFQPFSPWLTLTRRLKADTEASMAQVASSPGFPHMREERGNELGDEEEPGYEIMAQVLKLRTNPWRVHEAKYLPPTVVIYSHTAFHNDQAS